MKSDKLTVLVLSDRDTGLCLALSYLVTEMCRFIVHCVHTEVGWRCDGEPSTLALLEAVKRACAGFESCVACRTFSNRRPSGQWSRSQIEEATGCKGPHFWLYASRLCMGTRSQRLVAQSFFCEACHDKQVVFTLERLPCMEKRCLNI